MKTSNREHPKRTLGPPCPRCKADETQRERNFGREVKDGRWWCPECRHLWEPPAKTGHPYRVPGEPTKLTGCNLTAAERARWDRLREKRGDRWLSDTIRGVMDAACAAAEIPPA